MSKELRKIKSVVVAVIATAILILSVIGYISDVFADIKARFQKVDLEYDGSYVEMLDVGQGDSIFIYSGGHAALIDTGLKSYADDVSETLKAKGIDKLDMLLISHNHNDHMGGVVPITEEFKVNNFVIPDLNKTDERTDKMIEATNNVKASGGKVVTAENGMEFTVGDFNITVIGCYYDEKDENDRSIFVMAKIGKWKFLFTGDAQDSAEKQLMKDNRNLKCDVLKVGHHGSMYSSSEEFLEAVSR